LMRIQIRILAFKQRLKTMKKCSNRLIFHALLLFICKLMQIRIQIRIQFIILMRIRILLFNLMQILADPGPQI
jgi:hypothetical protein